MLPWPRDGTARTEILPIGETAHRIRGLVRRRSRPRRRKSTSLGTVRIAGRKSLRRDLPTVDQQAMTHCPIGGLSPTQIRRVDSLLHRLDPIRLGLREWRRRLFRGANRAARIGLPARPGLRHTTKPCKALRRRLRIMCTQILRPPPHATRAGQRRGAAFRRRPARMSRPGRLATIAPTCIDLVGANCAPTSGTRRRRPALHRTRIDGIRRRHPPAITVPMLTAKIGPMVLRIPASERTIAATPTAITVAVRVTRHVSIIRRTTKCRAVTLTAAICPVTTVWRPAGRLPMIRGIPIGATTPVAPLA